MPSVMLIDAFIHYPLFIATVLAFSTVRQYSSIGIYMYIRRLGLHISTKCPGHVNTLDTIFGIALVDSTALAMAHGWRCVGVLNRAGSARMILLNRTGRLELPVVSF